MNKSLILGIVIGVIFFSAIYFFNKQPLTQKNPLFSELQAVVYKTPTCGCCKEYINYLKANGFSVEVREVSDEELENVKKQNQIPADLWSCHTVFLNNYFVEGHMPVEAISKLLTEKPNINGIALPKMPSGSPGMPGIKLYPFKIYSVKDGKDLGLFMEI
ncbi:MAG: metal-binding protein [Candidatus Parcubacteria bacterium]|nr:MAG: metal-binding protein [Candidatus Parcubacteria bacterium]